MRSDRMIAILLMMQARGKVTAAEVAEELEVSVKTARRDLEALALAGLPVYSQPGRGGGWRLLGDGRTDLTGLSEPEASALVTALVNLAPLTEGTRPHTDAAVRKLVGALPDSVRDTAMRAAASTRLVGGSWERSPSLGRPPRTTDPGEDTIPIGVGADVVRDAILAERRADLVYRDRSGATTTRRIDPLGIVNKGGRWYLVAATDAGQRTFRLDRVDRLTSVDEVVRRPPDFDLDEAWRNVEAAVGAIRRQVTAEVVIDRRAIGRAQYVFGDRLELGDTTRGDSFAARVHGWGWAELAAQLAGLHPQVRVTSPDELRRTLASLGARLAADHTDTVA